MFNVGFLLEIVLLRNDIYSSFKSYIQKRVENQLKYRLVWRTKAIIIKRRNNNHIHNNPVRRHLHTNLQNQRLLRQLRLLHQSQLSLLILVDHLLQHQTVCSRKEIPTSLQVQCKVFNNL